MVGGFVGPRFEHPRSALVVPVARKAKREFGSIRGKISIGPEFFEPLPEDELERWGQ